MGEVIAALGAIAASAQLFNYTVSGANSLSGFSTRVRSAPLTVQQLNGEHQGLLRLALYIQAQHNAQDSEAHNLLRRHTEDMDALRPHLEGLQANGKDGRFTRLRKAIKLALSEREINRRLSLSRHGSDSIYKHVLLAAVEEIKTEIGTLSNHIRYLESQEARRISTYLRLAMSNSRPRKFLPMANCKFIGQAQPVQSLARVLDPTIPNTEHGNKVVLVGIGGSGKSEIAREVALRLYESLCEIAIFWLDGSTPRTFNRAFQEMLHIPQELGVGQPVSDAAIVKAWFESDAAPPWLIIIDNARMQTFSGDESVYRFLPESSNGRILMTTRDRKLANCFDPCAQIVDLRGMDRVDAQELLISYLPLENSHSLAINDILSTFEYLPLGIIQAGLYMSALGINPDDYLIRLRGDNQTSSELITTGLHLTWENSKASKPPGSRIICLSDLQSQNPSTAHLLATLCCLSGKPIPTTLIDIIEGQAGNREALQTLKESLILKPGHTPGTFNLNVLARADIRSELSSQPWLSSCMDSLLDALIAEFPSDFTNIDSMGKGSAYTEHVSSYIYTVLDTFVENQLLNDHKDAFLALASRLSSLLQTLSTYTEMNKITRALLNWTSYEASSALLGQRATSELCLGNFDFAAELCQNILFRQPTARAECNIETIRALTTLAHAHHAQGRLEDATHFHNEAWKMKNRLHGIGHRDTLISLNNIGLCLQAQGKHKSCEDIFRYVYLERVRLLEPDNPATLRSMNNLATSFQLQGRFSDAVCLHRAALAGKIRVFGEDHHETLRSKYNVATVLHYMRKTRKAEVEFRELAAAFKRKLGPNHPETLTAYENLASFLREEKRYQEAETVLQNIVPRIKAKYGEHNVKTLRTLEHLAVLQRHQKKYAEALGIAMCTLNVRKSELGINHFETQGTFRHVSYLRKKLGWQTKPPIGELEVVHMETVPNKRRRKGVSRSLFCRPLPLFIVISHALGLLALWGIWGLKVHNS